MNFTSRIVRGELNKIFARPAIFVMTAFFVIAMVFSALIFNPVSKQDDRIKLEANNVTEVWTAFNSETDTNRFKQNFDSNLESSANKIVEFYVSPNSDFITKENLKNQIKSIQDEFDKYFNHALNSKLDNLATYKSNLILQVDKFKNILDSINKLYPTILITKNNYDNLVNTISQLSKVLNDIKDEHSIESHKNLANKINDNKWIENLSNIINNNIKDIVLENSLLNNLQTIISTTKNEKLPTIINEFKDFKDQIDKLNDIDKTSKDNIEIAKNYINQYKFLVNEVINITYCSIMLNLVGVKNIDTAKNYYGDSFQNYEYYKLKEKLTKNTMLYESNSYEFEYANVFQQGFTSNYEANAYDYMYYAMELLSILIILFCVILGADMIAGEQTSGTLKLLAIRPYKRSKILNAKISATIILGLIFLIIGVIASFIIGYFTYGINNNNILVTFNGDISFCIPPILLMLIFVATLMIKIIFYTIIAVFLSTLFKSNIASISISFILYILIALFSNVLKSTFVYKYLPFTNVDLFRYFGGEFQNGGENIPLFGLDFTPPIISDMNFYYGLINIIAFSSLLLILTHIIFKQRDIN